ncbi:MAG: hypothetical protein EBR09_16960, partial [Proteobacteria bacterium]|nr:hypothetical protein [Pseudomonadota bacterium]
MPREEANDSPGAQRTLTDLWSMNLNPIREAVAQLRTPAERAESSAGAPLAEARFNEHGEARSAHGGVHAFARA